MSGLAHFIEDEGIATTGISLVREHTAAYRPPRFLWVPFPLGRPFGVPGDAVFQHEVLGAALALLERDDGPVLLEDFPRDAPAAAGARDAPDGWSCPVSFAPAPLDPLERAAALQREVERLLPWYELSLHRRARTSVGLLGAGPTALARFVAAFLTTTPAPLRADLPLAENLKNACEDLKSYYQEAAMARPGTATPEALRAWFWAETCAGQVMVDVARRLASSEDARLRELARLYLVPRTHDEAAR